MQWCNGKYVVLNYLTEVYLLRFERIRLSVQVEGLQLVIVVEVLCKLLLIVSVDLAFRF